MSENKPKNYIIGPDGTRISLKDLPLVAYAMTCGHLGRDYGVSKGDQLFCDSCKTTKRVKKILAT